MASKTKRSSGRSPIIPLLIFTWILVVCFVSVDYYRESRFNITLIDTYLNQVNLRVADAYSNGRDINRYLNDTLFGDNKVEMIIADDHYRIITSTNNSISSSDLANREEYIEAINKGRGAIIKQDSNQSSLSHVYSATKIGDKVYCSSLPFDTSATTVLESEELFIIFIIGITTLMSIIGVLMMRRFQHSVRSLEMEHEQAIHHQNENTRIKRQLTNNINHEIKTPISAIHGYLETIMLNPNIDEKMRVQFIEKSFEQSNRIINLLKDISEIAKMEEAAISYDMSAVNIRSIIDKIISDSAINIKDKGIRVKSAIDSNVEIIGNKGLIHSIFGNLIDNAITYSGARDLVLSAKKIDNLYHFKVSDNGIGIDLKHLPNIFERFYRVDNGRSRKIGGTGLGLSIVKNAVQVHGGTISVTNRKRGGLEFNFTLREKNS